MEPADDERPCMCVRVYFQTPNGRMTSAMPILHWEYSHNSQILSQGSYSLLRPQLIGTTF